jgi:hypothetical protein
MDTFDKLEQHAQVVSIIEEFASQNRPLSFGRIVAYDATTHSVKVWLLPQLSDEPSVTGFVPLASPWVGNGWGDQCAPVADQAHCLVAFMGRPVKAIFALPLYFGVPNPPPDAALKDGERAIRHKSGTRVKFHDDGSWDLIHKSGNVAITVTASGEIDIKSSAVRIGEGSFQTLLKHDFMALFNSHLHGGVMTGPVAQTTSVPVTPLTDAFFTKDTKAS